MELMEAIKTRRSIRKFFDISVPEEMIQTLIKAAMLAPSAGNQQPWHFIVVTDRDKLDSIPSFHPYCKMVRDVNVAIIICGDPVGKKWPTFWVQDCSAATQNLLLAARGLGLGTVWTGVYPEESRMAGARQLFEIPENVYPFAIVPIGWPDTEFTSADRYVPSLVHHNQW